MPSMSTIPAASNSGFIDRTGSTFAGIGHRDMRNEHRKRHLGDLQRVALRAIDHGASDLPDLAAVGRYFPQQGALRAATVGQNGRAQSFMQIGDVDTLGAFDEDRIKPGNSFVYD